MRSLTSWTFGLFCIACVNASLVYFDVAYVHGIRKSVVNMNEPIKEGEINHDIDVNYKYSTDKVMFTFGWNF